MGDAPGYILLSRKMVAGKDPLWEENRPRTKAEAWIDLLFMAAFRDHAVRVGNETVTLRRGEFLASNRDLAKRWRRSSTWVHNMLWWLQGTPQEGKVRTPLGRIRKQAETKSGTIYLVVNYDTYQIPENGGEAKVRTPDGQNREHPPAQGRNTPKPLYIVENEGTGKKVVSAPSSGTEPAQNTETKSSGSSLRDEAAALLEYGTIQAVKKAAWEASSLRDRRRSHVFSGQWDATIREWERKIGAQAMVMDLLSLRGQEINFPLAYCTRRDPDWVDPKTGKRSPRGERWNTILLQQVVDPSVQKSQQEAHTEYPIHPDVQALIGRLVKMTGPKEGDDG